MITLAFTGDLCLYGFKHAPLAEQQQAVAAITAMLQPYDLAVVNLECSLSEQALPDLKMNVPFAQCPSLAAMSSGVYCLANNHVKDSGAKALGDMLEFVQQSGADSVGAGQTLERACQPLIKTIQGITMAIVNVTDASHYAAKADEAGVAPLNAAKLLRQVRQLALQVDAVIVVMHADLEFSHYPAPWRVRLSRRLAKYCKLIIHHHPHTLQGIEQHGDCIIAYSLGNFVFPVQESSYMQGRGEGIADAMVLAVTLERTDAGVKAAVKQTIIGQIGRWGFVTAADAATTARVTQQLAEYSTALQDRRFLRQQHAKRCFAEGRHLLFNTWYRLARGDISQAWRYFSWHFRTDQHRNWLKGLLSFGWL